MTQTVESDSVFDDFYQTHFSHITVSLYAFVGDYSEAQDLAQEAFARTWLRWAKVSTYDDPAAFVRKIAMNLATSRWRRAKTALDFLSRQRQETVPALSPDRLALVAAIKTLPMDQRQVIVLHYFADYPVARIAAECNLSEGTVKSRLHRARTSLAQILSDVSTASIEVK